MNAAHTPPRRSPGLFTVVAIVCIVAIVVGRFLFEGSGSEDARPLGPDRVPAEERSPAAQPDLADPTGADTRAGAQAPPVEPARAEDLEGDPPERDVRREAWALVERLEELARTPQSFHAAALPVVDELTGLCSLEAPSTDGESVALELQRAVVADPDRTTLVRGAVFLALGPVVPQAEFWGTFTEWTAGHADVPLELVRTAALAAARCGDAAPCAYPLPLAKLSELPTMGAPELPGFYLLALDRIASGRACDALRRWLDLEDPRKSLFQLSNRAPPADVDLAAAGDYFVTAEVLYCVWGHRSLADTQIERALLEETRFTLADLSERSLVSLRAANFLVLSLARCNTTFFDAAVALTSDSGVPKLDFVNEMQDLLGEELGLVALERLERLRYSGKSSDQAELALALTELREDFLRDEAHDPEHRAVLLDYLNGLAADTGVSKVVRMCAVNAIASGGSWSAIREAAATSFQQGASLDLPAMILGSLMDAVRAHPEHRAEALALLQEFVAQSPKNAASLGVEAYIEELTQ